MNPDTADNLRERLTTLAHRIAPETAATPLYVVFSAEANICCNADGGCWGMTGPHLDMLFREAIGVRWQGRGWGILVRDSLSEKSVAGTFIHELAHIVDGEFPPRTDKQYSPTAIMAVRSDTIDDFAGRRPVCPIANIDNHGLAFHRALMHLRYRAAAAGCEIPFADLCASQTSAFHLSMFSRALGDEVRQCRAMPFSRIMARTIPKAFRKLWTVNRKIIEEQNQLERTL
ncbi:MAG: hypothetical protein ACHRHE_15215 [Tepidisphaerales bacterium]